MYKLYNIKSVVYILLFTFSLTIYNCYASGNENEITDTQLKLKNNTGKYLQGESAESFGNYKDKMNVLLHSAVETMKPGDYKTPVKDIKHATLMKNDSKSDDSEGNSTGDYILQAVIGVAIVAGVLMLAFGGIGMGWHF